MSAKKQTITEQIVQEFTHTKLIEEFNATWEIIPSEHIIRREPHTKAHTNYQKIKEFFFPQKTLMICIYCEINRWLDSPEGGTHITITDRDRIRVEDSPQRFEIAPPLENRRK